MLLDNEISFRNIIENSDPIFGKSLDRFGVSIREL